MKIVMRTLPPPLPKHLVMYNYMFQSLIVGLYDQEDEEKLVYTGVIKPIWPLDGSEPQLEDVSYTHLTLPTKKIV